MTPVNKRTKLEKAYYFQSKQRKYDLLGNFIEMRLTYEQWLDVWESSGHLKDRGRGTDKYVMSRKNDIGHYELGNVFIQLHSQNVAESNSHKIGSKATDEAKLNMSKAKKGVPYAPGRNRRTKKCTIDGIEIFNSQRELIKKYGNGKDGIHHPNFKYLGEE